MATINGDDATKRTTFSIGFRFLSRPESFGNDKCTGREMCAFNIIRVVQQQPNAATKPTATTTTKTLNNAHQSRPICRDHQSQFRFDNECYLNLPDNHKRVSISDAYASTEDQAILALTLPITGDSVEQPAFDYASVAALSAFMPSVTSAQLIASSMGPSASPAAVDEPNFVSVSMLFFVFMILSCTFAFPFHTVFCDGYNFCFTHFVFLSVFFLRYYFMRVLYSWVAWKKANAPWFALLAQLFLSSFCCRHELCALLNFPLPNLSIFFICHFANCFRLIRLFCHCFLLAFRREWKRRFYAIFVIDSWNIYEFLARSLCGFSNVSASFADGTKIDYTTFLAIPCAMTGKWNPFSSQPA